MSGAVITGAFVMASVGAFYLLCGKYVEHGRIFVAAGVVAGCIFSILQLFPPETPRAGWLRSISR